MGFIRSAAGWFVWVCDYCLPMLDIDKLLNVD